MVDSDMWSDIPCSIVPNSRCCSEIVSQRVEEADNSICRKNISDTDTVHGGVFFHLLYAILLTEIVPQSDTFASIS